MEINWALLTLCVMSIFVFSGFLRGWWKETVTTIFLIVLVVFLFVPHAAQLFIDFLNFIFATITSFLPDSLNITISNFLDTYLGVSTVNGAIQIDASDGGTWFTFLILFIGLATVISRSTLPSWCKSKPPYVHYSVTLMGSLFGVLLGILNGFLVIVLAGEYMHGRNLPSDNTLPIKEELFGTSVAVTNTTSATMSLQATEMPHLTILDSFLPWVLIALAILLVLTALKNRVNVSKDKDGFRKVETKTPLGYGKIDLKVK